MRTTFIQTLMAQAQQDPTIFLLCGDLGYSVLEPFAAAFPERFLNVGIAEQNMVGLAAGLSLEGYTVFCYSIGNFPTLRAMEQIRYDVAYHEANVKIIAVGGGYAYGPLSTSHHTTEELGMLRTIPGMVVTAPGDPAEVESVTAFIAQHRGPCYMRLNKAGEPRLHAQPPALTLGGVVPVRTGDGATAAVFATGDMVGYAARYLERHAPHVDLYSFPFVNPIDTAQLAALARRYRHVATLEEHQANGGFGSAVLERLHDLLSDGTLAQLPALRRIAIGNTFISSAGTQDYLRQKMGLQLDGWTASLPSPAPSFPSPASAP